MESFTQTSYSVPAAATYHFITGLTPMLATISLIR